MDHKIIILRDYNHSILYISKQSVSAISQVIICHSLHQDGLGLPASERLTAAETLSRIKAGESSLK